MTALLLTMRTSRGRAAARFAVIALTAVVVAALWAAPTGQWFVGLADRLRSMGSTGVLLFVAAYVISTVALVPGSVLTVAAGYAYGPIGGLLVASPASVIAATVAFVLGRTVLRGWARRWVDSAPLARALDRALGRDSFTLVLLLRLSPVIPYNALNYALSVTNMKTAPYIAASFLGMLPATWLFVYLGSLAPTATALARGAPNGGPQKLALTIVGLAATLVAVAVVTRTARRRLDEEIERQG